MKHPCVVSTENTIRKLRMAKVTGDVEPNKHISPEIYFSADLSHGAVSIVADPLDDGLLKATIDAKGQPEWLSLNIGLGEGAFSGGEILCFAYDFRCATPFDVQPFIRSGGAGSDTDTHIEEPFRFAAPMKAAVVMHQVYPDSPLTQDGVFHTLVLPLPLPTTVDAIEIHDLRLVCLGADAGISPNIETLGRLSV